MLIKLENGKNTRKVSEICLSEKVGTMSMYKTNITPIQETFMTFAFVIRHFLKSFLRL